MQRKFNCILFLKPSKQPQFIAGVLLKNVELKALRKYYSFYMLYINHFCNIDPCTKQRYIYTGTKEMSVMLSHCLWDMS